MSAHEDARAVAVPLECWLWSVAKKQDRKGQWAHIALQFRPEDLSRDLWECPLGARLMAAIVLAPDQGQPIPAARPIECRLWAVTKRLDGKGQWGRIVLQVRPEDLSRDLWEWPLGAPLIVAIVRVNDNEQPVPAAEPSRPWHLTSSTTQAQTRAKDPQFQRWLGTASYEAAKAELYRRLGVTSLAALKPDVNPAAVRRWAELDRGYAAHRRGVDG